MIAPVYVYEHDCPKDSGTDGCPVNGEQIQVRPTTNGNTYTVVPPKCLFTHVDLRFVGRKTL